MRQSVIRDRWRRAEVVVQTDAHDVVRHMAGQGHRREWSDCRERVAERAEVEIEIFELRRPVVSQPSLDAGARGPASPGRVEIVDHRDAALSERGGAVDLAIGKTAGGVEQPSWGRGDTNPTARCAEPRQFFVSLRVPVTGGMKKVANGMKL